MATGYVIYKGPSLLNGAPIVVIAITKSRNIKTGSMIQTHILVDNEYNPQDNSTNLNDVAVCGDCKHRRGLGGGCYVIPAQGPTVVYKAYKAGKYPESLETASLKAKNRNVRIGSYGDPAAVPAYVWESLLQYAKGHTGYTHQWQSGKADHVKNICMASADTEQERTKAVKNGWRTFRVRLSDDVITKGEFICPASNEAGKKKTCQECLACNGSSNPRKGSPVIVSHGAVAKRYREFRLSIA